MAKRHAERYDHQTLYEERRYGLYWYDWLWSIVRPLLIGLGAAILIGGLLLTGWNLLGERFFFPVDEADETPVTFVVESGASLSTVARKLESENLIRHHAPLKYLMDFRGMSQKVQTGEYTLTRAMSIGEIIQRLTAGDGNPLTRRITIIPGWTIQDMADYFVSQGIAESRQAFLDACNDRELFSKYYYITDVLKDENVSQRRYLMEGYLAPDTYEIYNTATLQNVMEKLVSQVEVVFNSEFHARAEEMGMTMDEVITLASIIEKEAKSADFAKVSAVFHERLRTDMSLGSDPTVQYITGSEKMALTGDQTGVDSPYNTYRNKGLPPGPICSPSADAIRAALYPDEAFMEEGYLYFCSMSPTEGTLIFSKTLEEHETAVATYRPLWEAYDQERGL